MVRLKKAFDMACQDYINSGRVGYSSDDERIIANQRREEIAEEYSQLTNCEKIIFNLGKGLLGLLD